MSGLSVSECDALVAAIYERRPFLKWLPSVAGTAASVGWIALFGRTTDALEGTRWDLLGYLHTLGFVGLLVAAFLGFGVAIGLGFALGYALPRMALQRVLRRHLYGPACFWCGYSLIGLQLLGGTIHCPECGRRSPASPRRR